MSFQVVLPVLAQTGLHGDAQTFGHLTPAMGVGAVLGGLVIAARGRAGITPLVIAAAGFGAAVSAAPGIRNRTSRSGGAGRDRPSSTSRSPVVTLLPLHRERGQLVEPLGVGKQQAGQAHPGAGAMKKALNGCTRPQVTGEQETDRVDTVTTIRTTTARLSRRPRPPTPGHRPPTTDHRGVETEAHHQTGEHTQERRSGHHHHVAVGDVRQLVGQDALQLVGVESVQQAIGHAQHRPLGAASGGGTDPGLHGLTF